MKQVSRSCAARAQKSSPRVSWRIWETKWSASRNASSHVVVERERVPPPRVRCVGDGLRVEHEHRALGLAGGGGGRPHVRLVGRGHDRAGRVEDARRGQCGGLAGPGRHHRDHHVFQRGVEDLPLAAPAQHPARRVLTQGDAGLAGADQRSRGGGQRRTQPLGFGDDLLQGQRRDRPPVRQRRQGVVAHGPNPQPPRPPDPPQRGHRRDEHDVDREDEPRAAGRPQLPPVLAEQAADESRTEVGAGARVAGQGGGDAPGDPGQPDRRDGRPGADHHQPRGERAAGGAVRFDRSTKHRSSQGVSRVLELLATVGSGLVRQELLTSPSMSRTGWIRQGKGR